MGRSDSCPGSAGGAEAALSGSPLPTPLCPAPPAQFPCLAWAQRCGHARAELLDCLQKKPSSPSSAGLGLAEIEASSAPTVDGALGPMPSAPGSSGEPRSPGWTEKAMDSGPRRWQQGLHRSLKILFEVNTPNIRYKVKHTSKKAFLRLG